MRKPPVDDLAEVLRALIEQHGGLSPDRLARRTVGYTGNGDDGISPDTIRTALGKPVRGKRVWPSPDTLRAIAYGLDIAPEQIPHYRLARAREQLDERAVGLQTALENLEGPPASRRRGVSPLDELDPGRRPSAQAGSPSTKAAEQKPNSRRSPRKRTA